MNHSQKLVIPTELHVGFQYANKVYNSELRKYETVDNSLLGFATYVDAKGVLRKEHSWESWRDKTISAKTFENKPLTNFSIGNVKKRSTDWFGSGRHVWRVLDPRGFELEITSENLQAIIDQCDINSGVIDGELIWVWSPAGKMALIPVESEDYKAATEFTKITKAKAISKKDYGSGDMVMTSKGDVVQFIGEYFVLQSNSTYKNSESVSTLKYVKRAVVRRGDKLEYYPGFKVVEVINKLALVDNEKLYKEYLNLFNDELKNHNAKRMSFNIYTYQGIYANTYHFSEKAIKSVKLEMKPFKDVFTMLDVKSHIETICDANIKNGGDSTWSNLYVIDEQARFVQIHISKNRISNEIKLSAPHTNISSIRNADDKITYVDKRNYGHYTRPNYNLDANFYVTSIIIPGINEHIML